MTFDYLFSLMMKNTFNVEEVNGTLSYPLSIVQHVKIRQVKESLNFDTLLDSLLWTCHPETVSCEIPGAQ